jgi:hypothetical protein
MPAYFIAAFNHSYHYIKSLGYLHNYTYMHFLAWRRELYISEASKGERNGCGGPVVVVPACIYLVI